MYKNLITSVFVYLECEYILLNSLCQQLENSKRAEESLTPKMTEI